MTRNPFHAPKAFEPMYLDAIGYAAINANTTVRTNLTACVFPLETVNPFADSDTENEAKCIQVLIRKAYWPFATPPKTGDEITALPNAKYRVQDVEDELDDFRITARSV